MRKKSNPHTDKQDRKANRRMMPRPTVVFVDRRRKNKYKKDME